MKDSYSYKKYEEALENFFYEKIGFKSGYSFVRKGQIHKAQLYHYSILTRAESDCLIDLCFLLNINIKNYLPMEYCWSHYNIRYIDYVDKPDDLPGQYFNYDDFKKLRDCIIEESINRKLIQFDLNEKTFWLDSEDYFKMICQLPYFVENYISRKTKAIDKLKVLFKRKVFYKINDMAQQRIDTNKLKNFVGRLGKPKFLLNLKNAAGIIASREKAKNGLYTLFKKNILKNTAQAMKNTRAIKKFDLVIKTNAFRIINNVQLKQKDFEKGNQGLVQEGIKNKKNNESKKSLRKKLIIGICIALILSLVILYFNLPTGIVVFAIEVCVLVMCGICKSKSNKIQGDPKILLNIPMNEQNTQPVKNSITQIREVNNVSVTKGDVSQNLDNNSIV